MTYLDGGPVERRQHKPECRACSTILDPVTLSPYCSRHRCMTHGCPWPRESPLAADSWTCSVHKDTFVAYRTVPSEPPLPSAPPPPHAPVVVPTLPSRPPTQVPNTCELCPGRIQYLPGRHYRNLCSRHRCTVEGCGEPRERVRGTDPTWLCIPHRLSREQDQLQAQPEAQGPSLEPKNTTISPPPNDITIIPTKKRFRPQSLFKWTSLGKKPGKTPPASDAEKPRVNGSDHSGVKSGEYSAPSPWSKKWPKSSLAHEPPAGMDQSKKVEVSSGDVGWHQCHAPACQDRVLSEEIWVCQKHLEQGFFDEDDPPGYMDRPCS